MKKESCTLKICLCKKASHGLSRELSLYFSSVFQSFPLQYYEQKHFHYCWLSTNTLPLLSLPSSLTFLHWKSLAIENQWNLCSKKKNVMCTWLHIVPLLQGFHQSKRVLSINLTLLLCLAACVEGKYGPGCQQVCECYHGGSCHPATGHCSCTPGWLGPTCREEDGEYFTPCFEKKCILITLDILQRY